MMHVGFFIIVTANEMQWRASEDFGAKGCMMPYASPSAYNSCCQVPKFPKKFKNFNLLDIKIKCN